MQSFSFDGLRNSTARIQAKAPKIGAARRENGGQRVAAEAAKQQLQHNSKCKSILISGWLQQAPVEAYPLP